MFDLLNSTAHIKSQICVLATSSYGESAHHVWLDQTYKELLRKDTRNTFAFTTRDQQVTENLQKTKYIHLFASQL